MSFAADDPESQARLGPFVQRLSELGWTLGHNVRIDYRWATDSDGIRRHAAELVALAPDVVLANSTLSVGPMLQATRTVPVVFVNVIDPVGQGFVTSLAKPSGNATGFSAFEFGLSGKWVELLKELAPRITRVAVIRDSKRGSGVAQFAAVQGTASSLGLEVSPVDASDASEMDAASRSLRALPMAV